MFFFIIPFHNRSIFRGRMFVELHSGVCAVGPVDFSLK
jgi:hypothetical protein